VEPKALGLETRTLAEELLTMGLAVAAGETPAAQLSLAAPTAISGDLNGAGAILEQQCNCSINGTMSWRLRRTPAPVTKFKISFDNGALYKKIIMACA